MKTSADVVIIGGGIGGCAVAYYLAKKGCSKVILLEKNYLTSGATGRCAGGIRTQLTSDIKIKLAQASLEIWKGLQQETQYQHDVEFNQSGYLSLAYTPGQVEEFKQTIAFQGKLGVEVDFLSPEEAKSLYPVLNIEGLLGAVYHREGATINPHLATHAFAQASQRLGVTIHTHTHVTDIKTKDNKVTSVVTDKGVIATSKVINAAGLDIGEIGKMVGIHIPVQVERMEAWVTEPLEHVLGPLIISWASPFFVCIQTQNGNLVFMGMASGTPESYRNNLTWQVLFETTPYIIRAFPAFRKVNIIRQWLGLIPVSPDDHPILGEVEQMEGFYLTGVLCSHGFMLSPMIGKLMAETILGEEPSISIEELSLGRFERGELLESHGLL